MPKRRRDASDSRSGRDAARLPPPNPPTTHAALEYLVGSAIGAERFLRDHFERAPLHVQRGDRAYYDRLGVAVPTPLYSDVRLIELLGETPLVAAKRMQVLRTTPARGREEAEPPADGLATAEWVASRLADGFTVQLFQPQTSCTRVHRLLAALEGEFGCLAGCSAYLTPRGKQGLAPHHDDVEVFVMQTQGSKRWCVYAPLDGFELPAQPSPSLDPAALGPCVLDVTLRPGDLLYLPRGWVHQATSTANGFSTHLTISAYQRHTWADYTATLLSKLLERATAVDRALREGLPPRILERAGSFALRRASVGSAEPRY